MRGAPMRRFALPGGMRGILAAFFLAMSLLLGGALVAILLTSVRPTLVGALERRGQSYANDLAGEAGFCLAVGDTTRLREIAASLVKDDEVHHVAIRDGTDRVLLCVAGPAHRPHARAPFDCPGSIRLESSAPGPEPADDDVFTMEAPDAATSDDSPARIEIAMSTARIDGTIGRWVILMLVVVATFGIALIRGLLPRLVDPIVGLADASLAVSHGELGVQVPEAAPAELGRLQTSFNRMVEALRDQEQSLLAKNAELAESLHRTETLVEELKQTQNAIVRTEKLRAIGEMASGVAHDFNNVLNAVLGRTQLLESRLHAGCLDSVDAERSLAVIRQAAEDGARTVQRLQQYTRGTKKTVLQPVRLESAVRAAVEMTVPRWRTGAQRDGRQIEIDVQIQPDAVVAAEASDLREVVMNLINNAVDAMPRGGLLRFTTTRESDRILLYVTDTGDGMDEEIQRRAFDPFFTTKGAHGSGLGLSVVTGILRRLGGAIQLWSKPGEGSRFTIELQAWSGQVREESAARAPKPNALQTFNLLIVDDNQTALENLREMLEALDQRVVAVDTGAAAVRSLSVDAFDAVITDLGMPEVNGWEVARSALERHPGLPIILCTGWSDEIDETDLRKRGLWRLLPKPYSMKQIEQALRELGERMQPSLADA